MRAAWLLPASGRLRVDLVVPVPRALYRGGAAERMARHATHARAPERIEDGPRRAAQRRAVKPRQAPSARREAEARRPSAVRLPRRPRARRVGAARVHLRHPRAEPLRQPAGHVCSKSRRRNESDERVARKSRQTACEKRTASIGSGCCRVWQVFSSKRRLSNHIALRSSPETQSTSLKPIQIIKRLSRKSLKGLCCVRSLHTTLYLLTHSILPSALRVLLSSRRSPHGPPPPPPRPPLQAHAPE